MSTPATDWKEIIDAGEEEKFKNYTMKLVLIQKVKNKEYGKGRLLHRKQVMALKAQLQVKDNLPEYCRHGIFSQANTYDCIIRLSNGGLDVKSDKTPDIRGFAIKIKGVNGKSALSGEPQSEQDFLMINHTKFSTATANEFLDMILHLSQGPIDLLKFMYKTHGFFGMIKKLKNAASVIGKPFSGFATENFSTVAPIQCGPYAVKVHIKPLNQKINPSAKNDLSADIKTRLLAGDIQYEIFLQFFINENETPIEDGSKDWKTETSPLVSVATLTISNSFKKEISEPTFAEEVEKLAFDPWNAITEHKPLGNIMRARKAAYYASVHNRKVRA